ncbi:unnamed protein product [Xylocopa violacea]
MDWILKAPKNSIKLPFWMPVHTRFQCEKTGFFPDKFNCKQFYRCLSFLTGYFLRHTYVCDGDRVYSSNLRNCVSPENNDRPECVIGMKETTIVETTTPSIQEENELDEQESSYSDNNTTPFEDSSGQDVENTTDDYVSLIKRQVSDDDLICENASEEDSEELDDAFIDASTDICPKEQDTLHVEATTQVGKMIELSTAVQIGAMKEQSTTVQIDTTTQQNTTLQVDTTEGQSTIVQDSTDRQDTVVQDSTEQQDTVVQDSTEQQDTVVQDSTEQQDTIVQTSTVQQDTTVQVDTIEQQSTTEHVHEAEQQSTTEHVHEPEQQSTTQHVHESEQQSTTQHVHELEQQSTTQHVHEAEQQSTTEHVHEPEQQSTTQHVHEPEQQSTTQHVHELEQQSTTEHVHEPEQQSTTQHVHEPEQQSTTEHVQETKQQGTTVQVVTTKEQSTTEQVHESEQLIIEQIGTTEQIIQQTYSSKESEEIGYNTEQVQTTEESTAHVGIEAKMTTKFLEITEQSTIEDVGPETQSTVQQMEATTDILKDNVGSTTVTEMSQTLETGMGRTLENETVAFEKGGSSDTTIGDHEIAQHSTTSASFASDEHSDEHKEQICVEEGFFADASNCSKFYRCVRFGFIFLKHEFTCAIGTIWDDRLKTCNFLAGVELDDRSCKYDATMAAQNRFTEIEIENKFSIDDLIKSQLNFVCPTGIRRHTKYCNLFYQCLLNDQFQMNFTTFACPEGTFFNKDKVQCLQSKVDEDCVNFQIDENRHPIEIIYLPHRDLCPDEGQFPYGVICSSKYLECVRNAEGNLEGYLLDCPAGYVYSPMTIGCLPAATFPACVHKY